MTGRNWAWNIGRNEVGSTVESMKMSQLPLSKKFPKFLLYTLFYLSIYGPPSKLWHSSPVTPPVSHVHQTCGPVDQPFELFICVLKIITHPQEWVNNWISTNGLKSIIEFIVPTTNSQPHTTLTCLLKLCCLIWFF